MKASEPFRKYPKIPVFDHSNYRLFERIPAVPGTSNNRDLTVDTLFGLVWVVLGCILKSYSVTAEAATFISGRGSGSIYLLELIPCLICANVRAFNGNTDRTFIYP